MYCLVFNLLGNTGLLDVIEITKIAISFHCDTANTFSKDSLHATVMTNVKTVMQKIGKDPEKCLVWFFSNLKVYTGILHCLKSKNKLLVLLHT